MQFASSFTLLAAFLTLASALPAEKRATTKNVVCNRDRTISGVLSVWDSTGAYSAALTDLTATDSQGLKKKVLVTKKADGSYVKDQTFDFVPCDSDFMGYPDFDDVVPREDREPAQAKREDIITVPITTTPVTTTPSVIYGHLSLGGALKHCLQTKTGSVKSSSVLTHSKCSVSDDKSQIQNFWAYDLESGEIKFVGQRFEGNKYPTSLSISPVRRGAIKLDPVEDDEDSAYFTLGQRRFVEIRQ